jgi:hypothetical protein
VRSQGREIARGLRLRPPPPRVAARLAIDGDSGNRFGQTAIKIDRRYQRLAAPVLCLQQFMAIIASMAATSPLSLIVKSPRSLLLAAACGIALLAVTIWLASTYTGWKTDGGPFVEFEIRLPPRILLPDDKNIDVTFWSEEIGRGCGIQVRRTVDPSEIAGRCPVLRYRSEYAMSVRLSQFAEGYWAWRTS